MMFDVFVRDIIAGSLCCGVEIFSNKEQERREEGEGTRNAASTPVMLRVLTQQGQPGDSIRIIKN